jgi:hypothetical protein
MSDDHAYTQDQHQPPQPNPDLKRLDKLVGTWKVSGPDIKGKVTFEWMEGGFFLIQHFDFVQGGHKVKGMEVIGHLQLFGEQPSQDIRSRIYDTLGNTFDYTYEVNDETLTIWGGERGSPAYYEGKWSEDGNTNSGAWHYPGGGGYESTMTRVKRKNR